jgi:hypothetical protein
MGRGAASKLNSTRPLLNISGRDALGQHGLCVSGQHRAPSRMRVVRWLIAACNRSGHGLCPICLKKCISVSQ